MPWMTNINSETISWLLEPDLDSPGVRYFALIDLLGKAPDDAEVLAAQEMVMIYHASSYRTRN